MAQNRDLKGTKTALDKATVKIREAAFTSSGWVNYQTISMKPIIAPAKTSAGHTKYRVQFRL